MAKAWIDFRAVKMGVSIEQLLNHYGVTLKPSGSGKELRGRCPIHKGQGSDSFHVHIEKNVFHCFSCGVKGNVLDFVAVMEQCSVHSAAEKLRDRFATSIKNRPLTSVVCGSPLTKATWGQPNKPLGFQLKGIDHKHSFLDHRGIQPETAAHFGVGFFSGKGSMFGRVVIPIHNPAGELVAYAGRAIDGSEPRYKLPLGFRKNQTLFNLHRALHFRGAGEVIVVEGFFDAMKVHQAGYPFVVALMGCSMSEEQQWLLQSNFSCISLMLDGDSAGLAGTFDSLSHLAFGAYVNVIPVPEDAQPDELTGETIAELIGERTLVGRPGDRIQDEDMLVESRQTGAVQ